MLKPCYNPNREYYIERRLSRWSNHLPNKDGDYGTATLYNEKLYAGPADYDILPFWFENKVFVGHNQTPWMLPTPGGDADPFCYY
jgi:hypothetical protein